MVGQLQKKGFSFFTSFKAFRVAENQESIPKTLIQHSTARMPTEVSLKKQYCIALCKFKDHY